MLLEKLTNERAISIDGHRREPALPLQVRLVPQTQLIYVRALRNDRRCNHIEPTQKPEERAKSSTRSVATLASSLLEVVTDENLVEVGNAAPTGLQPATEILENAQPNLSGEPLVPGFDQFGRECIQVRAEWTGAQDASFLLAYEVLDHVSSSADDRPSGGSRIMPNPAARTRR
jgi:hypothetical protein